MSQTQPRYQRTVPGMVGAMIAVLVLVAAVVGLRALTTTHQQTPVETVGYAHWVQVGRKDGKLALYAPSSLPHGWRATSVSYVGDQEPHWHLGILTSTQKYVGIEESLQSPGELLSAYVDKAAARHGSATVGGRTWRVWSGGGDYALVRTFAAPSGSVSETLLVVGSAPPDQVRSFAASLGS